MGALIFGVMFFLMILGVPIAFSISLSSTAYLMASGNNLVLLAQRLFLGMDSFVLLAVPLFVLTGYLMEQCGLSQRLIDWVECIFGRIPGSAGIVTIISCAIFAALTGSGQVTIAAIGALTLPALLKSGYKKETSVGMIACGGGLGPIIPPSVGMIVYGTTMSLSIPKMFMSAIVPGLLMVVGLLVVNAIIVKKEKIPASTARYTAKEKLLRTWRALPALLLPVIILGGIYGGVFTATEAAVIAVMYSLIVGVALREIRLKGLLKAFRGTIETSAMIALIIGVSNLFGWELSFEKIPQSIADAVIPFIKSQSTYLIVLCLIMLVVGALMETLTAIVILAPILVPIGTQMGIDPLVVGMVFCLTLIVGIVTPPFGVNLFVASSVMNEPFVKVTRGAAPFILSMLIVVIACAIFPSIITFLPSMMA